MNQAHIIHLHTASLLLLHVSSREIHISQNVSFLLDEYLIKDQLVGFDKKSANDLCMLYYDLCMLY